LIVAVGLVTGAVTGVVLERTGVVDPLAEPAPVVVRIDRVTVHDCPDGIPVGALARGDRVLATARSGDGDWLEIRSPLDLDGRAWVSSAAIVGDDGEAGVLRLPERSCDDQRPSTTTTSTSATTTSTTSTSTTSTTSTSTTTTSTTLVPTTSTSTTLPNVAPVLRLVVTGSLSGQPPAGTTTSTTTGASTTSTTLPPGQFFYVHVTPSLCRTDAVATVDAADPDGVTAVHLRWAIDGSSGQQPMVRRPGTDRWDLTVQFPAVAVPNGHRSPTFTVVATDGRGVETATHVVPASEFRVYAANQPCAR
jgi:hypothetical protein